MLQESSSTDDLKKRWSLKNLVVPPQVTVNGEGPVSPRPGPIQPTAKASRNSNTESQIIKLNIGGVKYWTTRTTLTSSGPNYFSALVDGRWKASLDEDGFIFIDRNGKYFEPILDYLRMGRWRCPPHLDEGQLLEEAQFYSIDVNVTKTITDTSIRQALTAAKQRGLREFVRDHQKALQRLADWVAVRFYANAERGRPDVAIKLHHSAEKIKAGFREDIRRPHMSEFPSVFDDPNCLFDDELFKLVSQSKEKIEDYLRTDYDVSVEIKKWFGGWNNSGKKFVFKESAPWAELENCNVSEWHYYEILWRGAISTSSAASAFSLSSAATSNGNANGSSGNLSSSRNSQQPISP